MGTISVSLPSDGQTIDAADYNTPINTIVATINGGLDVDNIEAGGVVPNALMSGTGTTWAWQSWTPTLSGRFDDADWTKTAAYCQIGKTVFFRMKLVATAAAPMGGGTAGAIFTLPVTAKDLSPTIEYMSIGWGGYYDSGTTAGLMMPVMKTTTTAEVRTSPGTGTSSTTPITWTTNDEIFVMGIYEAA